MVWMIFGIAWASVSDSASTRVTACSILSRCSARLRSEMSRETTTTFDTLPVASRMTRPSDSM